MWQSSPPLPGISVGAALFSTYLPAPVQGPRPDESFFMSLLALFSLRDILNLSSGSTHIVIRPIGLELRYWNILKVPKIPLDGALAPDPNSSKPERGCGKSLYS